MDATIAELKDFQVKHNGQLQLIKIFQAGLENTNELDSKINTLMNEIKKQEETNNTSNMHLTDADKEKEAFKNFNISKRTIKKLQAKQILDDFQSIVSDLSIVTIYGGKKYDDQENSIRNDCDILVATRGRLKDIVDKGKLDLTKIKHVILDEVDRMLDMGFIDDVEEILEHIFTPNRETKPQFIVFFSATMPDWVHKATKKYMPKDFILVDLVKGNTQKTSANVEHLAVSCTYQDRAGIIDFLVQIYSSSSFDGRAIVFCETKNRS
ncbi:unnamed protein product [Rotaria sp. Silwood2]|nr:unnamed protein product [Rotaria sp. Silwood2]